MFANVRVFDGQGYELSPPSWVLVRDSVIERISTAPIAATVDAVDLIDGTDRVLMPGLIDAHAHTMMAAVPLPVAMTADFAYLTLVASTDARNTLLRGFTSVRDVGGPAFGLKRAIDEGVVPGPRIWPAGATISQTGGHGDFRLPYEVPADPTTGLSHLERLGFSAIADSPDAVRLRAREQLRQGASHLKLMAGGGVASSYDPLDVAQYTEAEIRAAVEAAENWGTYVTVHAYTPRAIRMAVEAGVRCVEHGQLMDDATAALLAERGVWLCLQPFLDDEDAIPVPAASRGKMLEMSAGTDTAYALARKHGVKTAWGTDCLFDAGLATKQGKQLAKLTRWYTPAEVLRMGTSGNAELLALSGLRSPYAGRLGVVEEGAIADLILVDGDPLAEISLIARPDEAFLAIMKGGDLVKRAV
ncbi:MAG TPA: amidohydrolase family protein [Candidatus Limnocylindrales bacterium]|nr:amidohydrolase family protein [Candidatus Limnocylindrales bacterium]